MGKLYDDLKKHFKDTPQEELNKEWEEYKNKLEIKYFELFKKARQEDKQELIEKACNWLDKTLFIYNEDDGSNTEWVTSEYNTVDEFISAFRKAIEDLK